MILFTYQSKGVEFLSARKFALLADGMGLGKTAQAIVAANRVGAKSVVVICPAIARVNWRREFDQWGKGQALFVESYDKVVRSETVRQAIRAMQPDVLILDEAHYLKNRTSKRTKALYGQFCRGDGLVSAAQRVWLLTGTPAPNDVSELYPHLSALWPDLLPADRKHFTFMQRYVHTEATPFGLKILGNKKDTLPELRQKLSSVMLRRKAEDVLTDLPPIMWSDITVEAETIDPELACIEATPAVKALRAIVDDQNAELEDAESIALATLRKLTGVAKAPVIASMVAEELESNAYEQIIIFAHHRDVLDILHEGLRKFGVVRIDGSTSPTLRQVAIDAFQKRDVCRVFLGQIQACATAVTLHASNQVLFAEASWTPSDNLQAAKRAHRIGQTRPVFVRMVGLSGSIDEAVTRVLARKSRQIDEVIEEVA